MILGPLAMVLGDSEAATTALSELVTLSRTTGTAPCAVHCTIAGTTSTVWSQAFRSLDVRWSIVSGGPAGNYAYGLQEARSTQYGPNAGFLFTSAAGSPYTIRCVISDGTNSVTKDTTVTISDPDVVFAGTATKLININGDADFTWGAAYTGASQVNCAAGDVVSTVIAAQLASGSRLLFKPGSTFNSTAVTTISTGISGAQIGCPIGGTRAIFASTTAINTFSLTSASISDLTFYGIECNGSNAGSQFMSVGANGITNLTLYSMDVSNIGIGMKCTGTNQVHNLGIFECDFNNFTATSGGGCAFVQGTKIMIVGNNMGNNNVEHIIRLPFVRYAVISNNTLHDVEQPGVVIGGKHAIKMNAFTYSTDADISNWNLVCANKMPVNNGCVVAVEMRPQTNNADERVEDSIFERNWYIGGTLSQAVIAVGGKRIAVRNNIAVVTGAVAECLAGVERRGTATAPTPDDCWIYNNTAYSTDSENAVRIIKLGETNPCTNAIVYNNLFWAPNNIASGGNLPKSVHIYVNATGTIGDNGTLGNSSSAQIQGATSPFTDSTPADALAGEFAAANYAATGGTLGGSTLPILTDFFYAARSLSAVDMGADKA